MTLTLYSRYLAFVLLLGGFDCANRIDHVWGVELKLSGRRFRRAWFRGYSSDFVGREWHRC